MILEYIRFNKKVVNKTLNLQKWTKTKQLLTRSLEVVQLT